jgi:hypothetical protein
MQHVTYGQIANLVNLNLLSKMRGRTGKTEITEDIKLKCNVDYEEIQKIGLSIDLDIHHYLTDETAKK